MESWVLVNIGCIECGVSSAVVGVYDSEAMAEAEAERLSKSHGWREGGQNSFEVFLLPDTRNDCAPDYVVQNEPQLDAGARVSAGENDGIVDSGNRLEPAQWHGFWSVSTADC